MVCLQHKARLRTMSANAKDGRLAEGCVPAWGGNPLKKWGGSAGRNRYEKLAVCMAPSILLGKDALDLGR